jgi:hypothetical protein
MAEDTPGDDVATRDLQLRFVHTDSLIQMRRKTSEDPPLD